MRHYFQFEYTVTQSANKDLPVSSVIHGPINHNTFLLMRSLRACGQEVVIWSIYFNFKQINEYLGNTSTWPTSTHIGAGIFYFMDAEGKLDCIATS